MTKKSKSGVVPDAGVILSGAVDKDNRELLQHGTEEFRMSVHRTKVPIGMGLALFYHWHDEVEILYLEQGKVNLCIGSHFYKVSAGDIAVIPPGVPHMAYRDSEEEIEFVAVLSHMRFLASQDNDLIHTQYILPIFRGWKELPILIAGDAQYSSDLQKEIVTIEEHYETKGHAYELMVKSSMYRILYYLENSTVSQETILESHYGDQWVRDILYFVQGHYMEKLTLHDMAQQVNMSDSYFCRAMKRVFEVPPLEFLNQYRVNQAVILIESTERKLGDIAFDTGFPNVNRFTEMFKKVMHCTPLEYRKQVKKRHEKERGGETP